MGENESQHFDGCPIYLIPGYWYWDAHTLLSPLLRWGDWLRGVISASVYCTLPPPFPIFTNIELRSETLSRTRCNNRDDSAPCCVATKHCTSHCSPNMLKTLGWMYSIWFSIENVPFSDIKVNPWQRWANSVFGTEYKYKYYSGS